MKTTGTTKTRLTISIVAVLLVLTMLIGSTYAWFTDTATSSGNKIQAGNLDVDLIMDKAGDGTYVSIAGEDAAIFGKENSLYAQNNSSDTVWEPGKTQIVYLGVRNNGTLALKYYISLSVKGGLAPSLEYAIIDNAKAADLESVNDWNTLNSKASIKDDVTVGTFQAAPYGALAKKDDTDYFALAVHMKEDAGNTYQDKDLTIDVTVNATQLASEEDSFDNQYDTNYLTLTSDSDTPCCIQFSVASGTYQFSLDNGKTWSDDCTETPVNNTYEAPIIVLKNRGDKVLFKGENCTTDESKHFKFIEGGNILASGSVTSLTDGIGIDQNVSLSDGCYQYMFYNCNTLASAPELPATVLADGCYFGMFYNCTSLKEAPELPATVLAIRCYYDMFCNCTSLTTAPELPATVLADACYSRMFYYCTSLTTSPELPATVLAPGCYSNMFYNCTSLTTAPELPATILTDNCYQYMFINCSNLASVSTLPAINLPQLCYSGMFEGCSSLKITTDSAIAENGKSYGVITNGVKTVATYEDVSGTLVSSYNMFKYCNKTFEDTPDLTQDVTYYWYTEVTCFAAGTQITMSDGTLKNIEDIEVGDMVLAYDIINQENYETVVLETSEHVSTSICTIILTDGTKVECTPTHPLLTTDGFKSVDPNYIDAMKEYPSTKLNVGDMVVTENGTFAVESIITEQKSVPVYNFHVEGNGDVQNCTYIVNGIVAHNSSGC